VVRCLYDTYFPHRDVETGHGQRTGKPQTTTPAIWPLDSIMQNAVRLSGVAVDMKAIPVVHADGSVLMPDQWRWRAGPSARHLHWQVGQPERFLYLLLSRFSLSIWELRRLMIAVVAPPKTAAARPVAAAFSPGDQTELSAILLLLRFPRELVVFPVTRNANREVRGRPCRRTHGTTHGVGCTEPFPTSLASIFRDRVVVA
jgi:hypothetical protein